MYQKSAVVSTSACSRIKCTRLTDAREMQSGIEGNRAEPVNSKKLSNVRYMSTVTQRVRFHRRTVPEGRSGIDQYLLPGQKYVSVEALSLEEREKYARSIARLLGDTKGDFDLGSLNLSAEVVKV